MLLLHNPKIAGDAWRKEYRGLSSSKIILATVSSYDAEPHACSGSGEIGEITQAILAELTPSGGTWTTSSWLSSKLRVPLLVSIDAKGL